MGKKKHRIPADVKADILKRVKEDGIPVLRAANEAGVHETTVYDWLSQGTKAQPSWMEYNKIKLLTEFSKTLLTSTNCRPQEQLSLGSLQLWEIYRTT